MHQPRNEPLLRLGRPLGFLTGAGCRLGCAFIAGGYRMMTHPDSEKKKTIQTYNADAANVNSSMLVLSVICLVLPDVLFESQMIGHCALLTFSRFVSVMMLGMYGVFLWFQLVTHQEMFEDEDEEEEDGTPHRPSACETWPRVPDGMFCRGARLPRLIGLDGGADDLHLHLLRVPR